MYRTIASDFNFLQVKKSKGGYIDVPYMEEAVLVNLGALMQQWTSDKYLATVGIAIHIKLMQLFTFVYLYDRIG